VKEFIETLELSHDKVKCIELNDKCTVQLSLKTSHLKQLGENLYTIDENYSKIIILMSFFYDDGKRLNKEFSRIYSKEIHSEEDFYKKMRDAQDHAERFKSKSKVLISL
jgi:hypothetical protein